MAGRIPEHFIDDLIARVDIVDLIESHLPLRKAGRDFQALCPFHGEKTPSFTISREKQFYHCFGCGAHGTSIGFLMNYRNLEFREAVEELASIAGMEIPIEARGPSTSNSRELYGILAEARAHFERQLRQAPDKERAVEYLKGRGITGVVAKQFHIGYAPDGWRILFEALTATGISDQQLERAGLAIQRDKGGHYDRFRDRIMFPIHDRRGRVIGFGGRVLAQAEPKYLNSPETEVFHKGRELYGLHETLTHGQPDSLIVVEGYMDVIALNQFGMHNAVATLGTAITPDHLDQLFRHAPQVIFCFDGDAAGKRAAWKALDISLGKLEGNREVRFAFLPDGHDPDSAVREYGPERFFDAAKVFSLSDYLLDGLKQDIDTTTVEGRTRLVAKAEPLLRKIPDDNHRVIGAQRLADESGLDPGLIYQQLGIGQRRRQQADQRRRPIERFTSRSLPERVIAMLLQNPALGDKIDQQTAEILSSELENCQALLRVWQCITSGVTATPALVERFRDDPLHDTVLELASLDLNISSEAMAAEIGDAVQRLKVRAEDQRIKRIEAVPFSQWTAEHKAIVRAHAKTKGKTEPS